MWILVDCLGGGIEIEEELWIGAVEVEGEAVVEIGEEGEELVGKIGMLWTELVESSIGEEEVSELSLGIEEEWEEGSVWGRGVVQESVVR